MPKLEQWFISTVPNGETLIGYVYGHEKFEDGKPIRTSTLRVINFEINIAHTQNTTYILGEKKV